MLVSLTVGKVDAGVAVLLTQDNRLVSSQPLVASHPPQTMRLHATFRKVTNANGMLIKLFLD